VIQRRGRPGLGQKTLAQLAIFRPVQTQELQRHVPLQLVVVGEIDEAEAAQTEDFLDTVATDSRWHRFGSAKSGTLIVAARLVSICLFEVVHGSSRRSPTYSGAVVAWQGFLAVHGPRSRRIITERLPSEIVTGWLPGSRSAFKVSVQVSKFGPPAE
jgi:hypothetical protein